MVYRSTCQMHRSPITTPLSSRCLCASGTPPMRGSLLSDMHFFSNTDLSIGLEGNHTCLAEAQTGSLLLLRCTLLCCLATQISAFVEAASDKGSLQLALWCFMATTGGGERGGKMNLENLAIKHITCIYGPCASRPGIK